MQASVDETFRLPQRCFYDHASCHDYEIATDAQELAKKGCYNGVIFYRIIAVFMIQGGDPAGMGRGGTSIYGQRFEAEIYPGLRFTGAGILAMANSGPDANGMRVVQWLDTVAVGAQDKPKEDVKIHKARTI